MGWRRSRGLWSGAGTVTGLLILLITASCGGGGGGGGGGDQTPSDGGGPAATAGFTVTGQAFDGPLSGATVEVKKPDGTVLASVTTDAGGAYSVTVQGYEGPFLVEVSGGTDLGADGAPGTGDEAANTAVFQDIGYGKSGETVTASPNPVFSMALGLLDSLASASRDQIREARRQAALLCGFGSAEEAQAFPEDPGARQRLRKLAAVAKAAVAQGKTSSAWEFLRGVGDRAQEEGLAFFFAPGGADWSGEFESRVLGT